MLRNFFKIRTLPQFYQLLHIYRYISGKIFIKIQSVVFRQVLIANKQKNKRTINWKTTDKT